MARRPKSVLAVNTAEYANIRDIVVGNEGIKPPVGRLILRLALEQADVIAADATPITGWRMTKKGKIERDQAEAERQARVRTANEELAAIGTLASGRVYVGADRDVLTDGDGEWDFAGLYVGAVFPTDAGQARITVSQGEFGGTTTYPELWDEGEERFGLTGMDSIPNGNRMQRIVRKLYRLVSEQPGSPNYQYPPAPQDLRPVSV